MKTINNNNDIYIHSEVKRIYLYEENGLFPTGSCFHLEHGRCLGRAWA